MRPQYSMLVTVPTEHIDELGHVNNAIYLNYVETVARAHATEAGLPPERFLELGGVFVVRRHEVTYFKPAYEGDELSLRTWIRQISGARCTRIVEILRSDELLVEAQTEWVWMDPATRSPKRMPEPVLAAFPAVTA